jgi:hypothetical protein
MKPKIHPFKHIQVVEDLCALIGETPVETAFDLAQDTAIDGEDWDTVIDYIGMMMQQLQEFAVEPLSQLCLLQMIDSVHTLPDVNWDCIGNMHREVYLAYRDSFLHMSDLDTILPRDYNIALLPQY